MARYSFFCAESAVKHQPTILEIYKVCLSWPVISGLQNDTASYTSDGVLVYQIFILYIFRIYSLGWW